MQIQEQRIENGERWRVMWKRKGKQIITEKKEQEKKETRMLMKERWCIQANRTTAMAMDLY